MPDHEKATLDAAIREYLQVSGGDAGAALRSAVTDLLEIAAEAEFRREALDQWVSRGYIQGKASNVLARLSMKSRESPPLDRTGT